ncbi:MAG TPA: glycosyltransferase family 4 protein [Gemmataceae bacterium]
MHVEHFVHRYPPALGGSESYFARLGRFLVGEGADVTVWTTTALDLEAFWQSGKRTLSPGESVEGGVRVKRFACWHWPGRRYLLKLLSFVPSARWKRWALPCNPVAGRMWLEAGAAGGPCDVVHASAFPYAWPIACGLRRARKRGVPFLLTPFLHLGDPARPGDRTRRQYTAPALRSLLLEADRVFVQTPTERDAVVAAGVRPERVVLQGLGVEPAECTGGDRERARAGWGVAEGEVVVGHLANQSEEKGTNDLLRAAEAAWGGGARFRVVLAGPAMANFRRFWPHFGPKQRVVQLGPLTDEQKRDFFAGLDVFALPSRCDSFGLVLLEAWANGLPNVAYRAGGVADLIRHERDGLLAPCGDVPALAEALARLTRDAGLRRRLGEEGRARVGREFVWEEKLSVVRRVMAEVTGKTFNRSLLPQVA